MVLAAKELKGGLSAASYGNRQKSGESITTSSYLTNCQMRWHLWNAG